MGLFAVIGVTALWLLYGWLASAIVASFISGRKGWGEHSGIASGLLLSAAAPVLWLVAPPSVRLPLALDRERGAEIHEPVAVRWPIGRLVAFIVVSLFLYVYFWFGVTRQHVSQELRKENDHPGLQTLGFALPVVNLVLLYLLLRDVDRLRGGVGQAPLGTGGYVGMLLLMFVPVVGAIAVPVLVSGRLNEFWDARTNGQAIDLPATGWDWAAVVTPIAAILLFLVVSVAL
jgi:hypothetical protein